MGAMPSMINQKVLPMYPSPPNMMGESSNNYYHYAVAPENHRSDYVERPHPLPNKFLSANQVNETAYNNYISKLTAAFDLNNNVNSRKSLFSSASQPDTTNRVLDYTNKRMALESFKHLNQTEQ